jgi:hypothetical protein
MAFFMHLENFFGETSMSATVLNGKPPLKLPRKQLADQLERLDEQLDRHDSILDALAEGLNEAVKEATQVGVHHAVKDAVVELLTNPDLRTALHQASVPPTRPNFWQRCKAKWQALKEQAKQAITRLRGHVTAKIEPIKTVATNMIAPSWRIRKLLLMATGVGLAVTVLSSVLSHNFAAMLSGIGAAVTTIAVQIGLWVRQTLKRLARL